jgi:hypothetical protein
MALFHRPWMAGIASKFGQFRKRGGRPRRRGLELKSRCLRFDPLEERALLTITPLNTSDVLASPTQTLGQIDPTTDQLTNAAHSIATDNKGDYVVTWTRTEPMLDPATNYTTVLPGGGTVSNIYAQYFTDDVQQLTLPASVLSAGKMSLVYGGDANGHVVQKLSVAGTYPPASAGQSDISGTFQLALSSSTPTTLTAAVAATDTTISVASFADFPATNNFTIQVGGEFMVVTAGAGTATWTVVRGADGSTAAAHALGDSVYQEYTTEAVLAATQLAADLGPSPYFDTSVSVASAAGFPATNGFTIKVGNEYMVVTAGAGTTTWTVVRGAYDSTAAAYATGDEVFQVTPPINFDETQFATGAAPATPLTAAVSAAALQLNVQSFAAFPATNGFTIQVGTEYMVVTGGAGTDIWTVTRGADGTTPAAYSAGDDAVLLDSTTLTAPVSAFSNVIKVQSIAGFPTTDDFTIQVGSEQMEVVAGAGTTTWTVERGANNTTPAADLVGSPVLLVTSDPVALIQAALQAAGGPFAGATVQGTDPQDYQITFADAYNTQYLTGPTGLFQTGIAGQAAPLVTAVDADFAGGFLPAVEASLVSQPNIVGGANLLTTAIPVSATNPSNTAAAIGNWLEYYSANAVPVAPTLIQTPAAAATVPGSEENDFATGLPEPYPGPVLLPTGATLSLTTPGDALLPDGQNVPIVSPSDTTATTLLVTPISDPNPNDTTAEQIQYSCTHFSIEFTGANGAQIEAPLKVTDVTGNTVLATASVVKQSSGAFLVNQPEPNPFSPGAGQYNALDPAVAMDSNGTFEITWEAQVANSQMPGTTESIFARRFQPTTFADSTWMINLNGEGAANTLVPCVVPLPAPLVSNLILPDPANDPYTFQVNTLAATAQTNPAIATDPQGDFTIVWQGQGPDLGYFNNIFAREFDRTGRPTGNDISVSNELTNIDFDANVAMDNQGDFGVSWADTSSNTYQPPQPLPPAESTATLKAAIYDSQGNVLVNQNQLALPGGGAGADSTIAFDDNDNFVIGWDELNDTDSVGGAQTVGVYAAEWTLQPEIEVDQRTMTGAGYVTLAANGITSSPALSDPNNIAGSIQSEEAAQAQVGEPATITWSNVNTTGGVTTATVTLVYQRGRNLTGIIATGTPVGTYKWTSVATITQVGGLQILRNKFRVNSADLTNPNSVTQWPGDQELPAVAMDASGDLTVSYSGFGPAVSENVQVAAAYYAAAAADPANADLAAYLTGDLPTEIGLHPETPAGPEVGYEGLTGNVGSDGGVQGDINATLINAAKGITQTETFLSGNTQVLNTTATLATLYVDSSAGFPAASENATTPVTFNITVGTGLNAVPMTVLNEAGNVWTVELPTTTLAAPVAVADTTINVESAAGFPKTNGFTIQVGAEDMIVTAGAGTTTWTVTRGADGTVAAAYLSGAAVALAKLPATTLTAPVTAAATHVSVASAAGFPATNGFTIEIDNEEMVVTAGAGTTTWTVTRGADGTTAAAHLTGAAATLVTILDVGEQVSWTNQAGTTAMTTLVLPPDATQVVVSNATGFPVSVTPFVPFQVMMDDETMTVTAVSGVGNRTWTVERTAAGATTHAADATITLLDPLTSAQLGRLSAILDSVAGQLNGAADSVMFSQFDANPSTGFGPSNILLSDSPVSDQRTGENTQALVILDRGANWNDPKNPEDFVGGSFQLVVGNGTIVPTDTITVTLQTANNGNELTGNLDTVAGLANLSTNLKGAQVVGKNWVVTQTDPDAEGGVDVRLLSTDEIAAREGTDWDLADLPGVPGNVDANPGEYYVFEVTFEGEVHDTPMDLTYNPNSSTLKLSATREEITCSFAPAAADLVATPDANNNATQPRKFALIIDGKNTTADLTVNLAPNQTAAQFLASMNATANQIQTAITGLATQNPALAGIAGGVTVTWVAPAGATSMTQGYFDVVYDGAWAGIAHTLAIGTTIQGPPPAPAQGQPQAPDIRYAGTISFYEVNKGVLPTTTPVTAVPVPLPMVAMEQEASEGTEQSYASIAETRSGNFVVAWTQFDQYSDGADVSQDDLYNPTDTAPVLMGSTVYTREFQETTETTGPLVAGLFAPDGTRVDGSANYKATVGALTHLIVSFDSPMLNYPDPTTQLAELGLTMLTATPAELQQVENNWADSVRNPANYQLSLGTGVVPQVASVQYGLNEASYLAANDPTDYPDLVNAPAANRLEAVLTFASPLSGGTYTLTVSHPIIATTTTAGHGGVENIEGNPLARTGYAALGADYVQTFTLANASGGVTPGQPATGSTDTPISPTQAGNQFDPSVATAANGNYVVVWNSAVNGAYDVVGQLFNATKTPLGTEFIVSTLANAQSRPDVAMDAAGDFVVVWSGAGTQTNTSTNTSDVFAQVYNFDGNAVGATIQVNTYDPGVQNQARVAMDATDGEFVVAWTSYGQRNPANENTTDIYYREFQLNGTAEGATATVEQPVNDASLYAQSLPDVAMDASGDFVIVWDAATQSSNTVTIAGRYYSANGPTKGSELTLNALPVEQSFTDVNGFFGGNSPADLWATGPRVSMQPATGNFVATWANYQSATTNGYNVFERRFQAPATGATPVALDAVEKQVNNTAPAGLNEPGWQLMPAVSVAASGAYTVVWTSFGQDNAQNGNPNLRDYGVYYQMYNADGSVFVGPNGAGPFRVNATTAGDQLAPAIDRQTTSENATIAWVGPTGAAAAPTGIFAQVVDPPAPAVKKAAATTATLVASASAAVFGQTVTFTATVKAAAGTPTGNVTFQDGSTTLGTGTLNGSGQATFTTSALSVASHTITASYAGNTSFNASTSGSLAEKVNPAATTTTIVASPSSAVFGQAATFTATVKVSAPGTGVPGGVVTFKDGSVTLGTGVLNGSGQAIFSTSALAVASHTITASYAGTVNVAASASGKLTEKVNKAVTTTTVTASANPSVFGQTVTFTAVVKASAPSLAVPAGTVTFKNGSTTLGTVTLNSAGQATFHTAALSVGSHTITVVYAGNASLGSSTSAKLTQTVNRAATKTSVIASLAPSALGQSVTFTATVAVVAPGIGVPTGTVTFKDGSTTLGTGTLNSAGQATFKTSALKVGSHTVTVVYAGTTNLASSTSLGLVQTVSQTATAALALAPNVSTVISSPIPTAAAVDQVMAAGHF